MRKLPEVQEAKELMTAAMDWSTFKWLFEKTSVRATADRANAALDKLNHALKVKWSEEAKSSYKKLSARTARAARHLEKDQQPTESSNSEIDLLIEKVIKADDVARRARLDAEETFDLAEKRMSIDLAREGCKKAIHSWELLEKAIRQAQAVAERTPDRLT